MANFFSMVTLFIFLFNCGTVKQKIVLSMDKTVSIYFPADTNPNEFDIRFYITGSFGGYSSFIRTDPRVHEYEIPTSYEGKAAKTLKLIIFSPKYQTEVFEFPTLEKQKQRIELETKPLKTVPLYGKVLLPNQVNTEKLQLQISYTPSWQCVFFKIWDCSLGFTHVASINLEKDGSFKTYLPDFANDKVINSLGETGEFYFNLQNKKTGKSLFGLKPKDNAKGFTFIKAASDYPVENVFVSESEK